MTQNATTPSAYNHLKVCICNEASTGHTKDCPKRAASAPLTHEEVERKIKEIERRYRITSYSPWKDDVRTLLDIASALQSQLQSYREDAEKMAGALEAIRNQDVPFEIDTTLHLECRELAGKSLSSLHHIYPPKQ